MNANTQWPDEPLTPFQEWMVHSNLSAAVAKGIEDIRPTADLLRSRGYDQIADAVVREWDAWKSKVRS